VAPVLPVAPCGPAGPAGREKQPVSSTAAVAVKSSLQFFMMDPLGFLISRFAQTAKIHWGSSEA
jgi:hypothetical protein